MRVSANISKRYPVNTLFVFKCIFLIYPLELLIKYIGILMGYKNSCTFDFKNDELHLTENIKFMGINISDFTTKFPDNSISVISTGQESDPGLIIMGIVFLFYLSVWGIMKLFSGFIGAEPTLVFYGFLLIFSGFIIDGVLLFLNFYFKKKKKPVFIIIFENYPSLVLTEVKGDLKKLVEKHSGITVSQA